MTHADAEGAREKKTLAQAGNSVLISKLPALLRHTPLTEEQFQE